ncbi:hypothetical protein KQI49_02350 [Virgibacillus sp. MSJ-26]|uniref:hypothetical protein n=1 Tax=Virgibacillus sp. MSJ-26 TaxID=2841522 RepID=UPI001C100993|nr:hypothetical protein [Virgibacillus sp. MSJ-26]MBU5465668.1 hypothetical protein [Virgibacillus sp. MSJ-26]
MVILPAELFLILVSIVTWKKKTIYKKEKVFNRPFSKNEWIGLVIGVVFLSTFSLIFLGAGVPFPATLVILSLMASFPLGLYSILFAPLVIVNYEANVYDNSETIMGYFFKYFYIVFFGLTYHVHCTLLKMPFLVNKLFAILYTGLVVWEAFMIILYFDL